MSSRLPILLELLDAEGPRSPVAGHRLAAVRAGLAGSPAVEPQSAPRAEEAWAASAALQRRLLGAPG